VQPKSASFETRPDHRPRNLSTNRNLDRSIRNCVDCDLLKNYWKAVNRPMTWRPQSFVTIPTRTRYFYRTTKSAYHACLRVSKLILTQQIIALCTSFERFARPQRDSCRLATESLVGKCLCKIFFAHGNGLPELNCSGGDCLYAGAQRSILALENGVQANLPGGRRKIREFS
jgi:hypothetical protein